MTKQQRQALEEAIDIYAHARMGVKCQHTEVAKMRAMLKLDGARMQLKLLLDSLMEPM